MTTMFGCPPFLTRIGLLLLQCKCHQIVKMQFKHAFTSLKEVSKAYKLFAFHIFIEARMHIVEEVQIEIYFHK